MHLREYQAVKPRSQTNPSLPPSAGNHRPERANDGSQAPLLPLSERLALSPAEAAQTLGVSETHLRSLLPELPHRYLGRRIVIPVDLLREWLHDGAQAGKRKVDAAVEEILDEIR